ncbi:MAG: TrkA family potassium uptake protein [Desulfovibrio sp.]|nr:MAG: TrkA family potassium uptake protein [Desulfovibrio sp.]
MATDRDVGIVGLGKFGMALAEYLLEQGHTILGVDRGEARVKAAQDLLDQVFRADATDQAALAQLGFGDLRQVIVCVGQSMEASILATLHLKELGVESVWVKAVSDEHERVLEKLGADYVVFPERFVAKQLAHKLTVPGLVHSLPLSKGVVMQEIRVENWSGKTLRELDLPNSHQLRVVALQRKGEGEFDYLPFADMMLGLGDIIVAVGDQEAMKKIEP